MKTIARVIRRRSCVHHMTTTSPLDVARREEIKRQSRHCSNRTRKLGSLNFVRDRTTFKGQRAVGLLGRPTFRCHSISKRGRFMLQDIDQAGRIRACSHRKLNSAGCVSGHCEPHLTVGRVKKKTQWPSFDCLPSLFRAVRVCASERSNSTAKRFRACKLVHFSAIARVANFPTCVCAKSGNQCDSCGQEKSSPLDENRVFCGRADRLAKPRCDRTSGCVCCRRDCGLTPS